MPTSQFDSALERRESALLGMWAFLATEAMLFGPLFFGYVHGRLASPDAFVSASHHMHVVLGTLNTAILMTSSLTVVLALRSQKSLRLWLALTALLGIAFLGIKAFEYWSEASEAAQASGGELEFYFLYYAMTGLHAFHLLIGLGLVAWMFSKQRVYEEVALYWHFVDAVWVFLYPMFYLLQRYAA